MKDASRPWVTVIMPVRNEADFIEKSLGAVLAQDYPKDRLEILIADGMSTDETRDLIRSLDTGSTPIRILDNPGRIVATGLNIALKEARGVIIVRIDGHCEIAPEYVRRCVEHLEAGTVAGVGGAIETVGESYRSRAIAAAMSSNFGVGGSAFRTGRTEASFVDSVAFPAYPRSILEAAGPYDEELVRNQDDEYNYRLRKAGHRLLLAPDVRSRYFSRATVRSLWRQYRQYGFWKVRVLQKHPRQMRARQFAPPLFVGTLLACALLALVGGPLQPAARLSFLGIAGLYIVANLTASVLTAARTEWRFLPLLPILYGALHLGYGTGFLLGLLRFAHRWGSPR